MWRCDLGLALGDRNISNIASSPLMASAHSSRLAKHQYRTPFTLHAHCAPVAGSHLTLKAAATILDPTLLDTATQDDASSIRQSTHFSLTESSQSIIDTTAAAVRQKKDVQIYYDTPLSSRSARSVQNRGPCCDTTRYTSRGLVSAHST